MKLEGKEKMLQILGGTLNRLNRPNRFTYLFTYLTLCIAFAMQVHKLCLNE